MGARWAWHALCVNGHFFSNFSGGSDGACSECGTSAYVETECFAEDDTQDCQECWANLKRLIRRRTCEHAETEKIVLDKCVGCGSIVSKEASGTYT